MNIFNILESKEKENYHEQIHFFYDKKTDLKAIVAIHNTFLGPAIGGVRMMDYKTEDEALQDVLRLSKLMTYKAAFSGLSIGGGKAVIIGDSKTHKSESLLRSFAKQVQGLNGKYITAQDVGISNEDVDVFLKETSYVVGVSELKGGLGGPSFYTACGVLEGIRSAIKFKWKKSSLKGAVIAVQGVGKAGKELVKLLVREGVSVMVSDISESSVRQVCDEFSVQSVDPEKILKSKCDVLAPCALGGVVNDRNIDEFQCRIVAGAANNVLERERLAQNLKDKGILFIPDFVINSGGLISVFMDFKKCFSKQDVFSKILEIQSYALTELLEKSEKKGIIPYQLAKEIAEKRLDSLLVLRTDDLNPKKEVILKR